MNNVVRHQKIEDAITDQRKYNYQRKHRSSFVAGKRQIGRGCEANRGGKRGQDN